MSKSCGSALWGSTGKDGTRGSALWGRGGRRAALLVAGLAVAISPAAAPAAGNPAPVGGLWQGATAAVPQSLRDAISANPASRFPVIVQGDGTETSGTLVRSIGMSLAKDQRQAGVAGAQTFATSLSAQFRSIEGVAATLPGTLIARIARADAVLSITPDAPVAAQAYSNPQKWDDTVALPSFWKSSYALTKAATIAVVDSGIDNSSGTFGNRILASVDMGRGTTGGDDRGHGTFVASLAAGATGGYSGVAPTANLVSVDVFDAQGRTTVSNVVKAADWILANKGRYAIRVANFSLITSVKSSFMFDPVDQAVERLWESGVVVVAAAGNYASGGHPSGVFYAPANDPFVITVGAVDIKASTNVNDDLNAPWSSYGYTLDGFAKPEVGAPGRYLIEQVPASASLFTSYPNNVVGPGKIQLSGTSFSAPIVAGMAAVLLGVHPTWTPDQVKGALMLSAVPLRSGNSEGVGEVNLQRALALTGTPPNPNLALESFLRADPAGGPLPVFDPDGWKLTAFGSPSWDSASWSSASWSSASWSSASWSSASWSSASWSSASWSSASWSSASWSSSSIENNADSDGTGDG